MIFILPLETIGFTLTVIVVLKTLETIYEDVCGSISIHYSKLIMFCQQTILQSHLKKSPRNACVSRSQGFVCYSRTSLIKALYRSRYQVFFGAIYVLMTKSVHTDAICYAVIFIYRTSMCPSYSYKHMLLKALVLLRYRHLNSHLRLCISLILLV